MAIWVFKPAERDGGELTSGVTTFESNDDSTTLGTYWSSSGALANAIPRAGHTTDQISDSNWYDDGYTGSSVGVTIMLFKVTEIGSNSSPTISDLNNDQLITDVLHSNASGSANGVNHYSGATTAYTMDWNNQSLTSNGTTYALDGLTQITGNALPDVRQRTQNNDQGDVYYNGILVNSQTGGSSGNEYYTDDTFGTTLQYIEPRTFTSGDFSTKVQGTLGGSTFVNQGRSLDIDSLTQTDSQKLTALLRAIDIQTYREFKRKL